MEAGELRQHLKRRGVHRYIICTARKNFVPPALDVLRLHQERQRHAPGVHRAANDQRTFSDEHRVLRVGAVEELVLRQARIHVKLRGGKV